LFLAFLALAPGCDSSPSARPDTGEPEDSTAPDVVEDASVDDAEPHDDEPVPYDELAVDRALAPEQFPCAPLATSTPRWCVASSGDSDNSFCDRCAAERLENYRALRRDPEPAGGLPNGLTVPAWAGANAVAQVCGRFTLVFVTNDPVESGLGLSEGFHDAVSGGARRDAVCRAFDYLSGLIAWSWHDVSAASPLDQPPPARGTPIIGVYGVYAPQSFLGAAWFPAWSDANPEPRASGPVHAYVTRVDEDGGDVAVGRLKFNFRFAFRTDSAPPFAPNTYDLARVALHEGTHLLGFLANITVWGTSLVPTSWNKYSHLMELTGLATTVAPPFTWDAPLIPQGFVPFASADSNRLFYRSVLGPAIAEAIEGVDDGQVLPGRDLSHFTATDATPARTALSFTMSPSSDQSAPFVPLAAAELSVLCNIGYQLRADVFDCARAERAHGRDDAGVLPEGDGEVCVDVLDNDVVGDTTVGQAHPGTAATPFAVDLLSGEIYPNDVAFVRVVDREICVRRRGDCHGPGTLRVPYRPVGVGADAAPPGRRAALTLQVPCENPVPPDPSCHDVPFSLPMDKNPYQSFTGYEAPAGSQIVAVRSVPSATGLTWSEYAVSEPRDVRCPGDITPGDLRVVVAPPFTAPPILVGQGPVAELLTFLPYGGDDGDTTNNAGTCNYKCVVCTASAYGSCDGPLVPVELSRDMTTPPATPMVSPIAGKGFLQCYPDPDEQTFVPDIGDPNRELPCPGAKAAQHRFLQETPTVAAPLQRVSWAAFDVWSFYGDNAGTCDYSVTICTPPPPPRVSLEKSVVQGDRRSPYVRGELVGRGEQLVWQLHVINALPLDQSPVVVEDLLPLAVDFTPTPGAVTWSLDEDGPFSPVPASLVTVLNQPRRVRVEIPGGVPAGQTAFVRVATVVAQGAGDGPFDNCAQLLDPLSASPLSEPEPACFDLAVNQAGPPPTSSLCRTCPAAMAAASLLARGYGAPIVTLVWAPGPPQITIEDAFGLPFCGRARDRLRVKNTTATALTITSITPSDAAVFAPLSPVPSDVTEPCVVGAVVPAGGWCDLVTEARRTVGGGGTCRQEAEITLTASDGLDDYETTYHVVYPAN